MKNTKITPMHIDRYEFGRIQIDGQEYSDDVLIFGGKVKSPWWRKNGHHLTLADLKELLASKPSALIIGTGYSGIMTVDDEVIKYCKEHSIILNTSDTKEAVKKFNNSPSQCAALHLTC